VGEAHERDGRGRALPAWPGCRVVCNDELFVMNPDVPDSLDGRYFGMIPTSSVVGQAIPVWIKEQ
jgi:type IV secretory pathway protease TraF